jgi:hypothetical protein
VRQMQHTSITPAIYKHNGTISETLIMQAEMSPAAILLFKLNQRTQGSEIHFVIFKGPLTFTCDKFLRNLAFASPN